jgi:hypothetical protein
LTRVNQKYPRILVTRMEQNGLGQEVLALSYFD